MSCKHFQRGAFFEDSICGVTKKKLSNYTVTKICDTWMAYTECKDYKKAEKSCFITTAVCETLSKRDDCHELTSMRSFRDNWLKKQPCGETEIQKYYAIAPKIVETINAHENAGEIYSEICERYVVPCVELTDKGENAACYELYKAMIENLQQKYAVVGV